MKKVLLLSCILLLGYPALADNFTKPKDPSIKIYEKDYNKYWCTHNQGKMEVTTKDGSRVDCLLPQYAVECDRANKWKEAVGQSLLYGIQTNRSPGILLIIENKEKEQKYIDRLNIVAKKYRIKIWEITPEELKH